MRDALIAAAGLALLAAPTAAQAQVDLEFEGSDRVTTCEVRATFTSTVTRLTRCGRFGAGSTRTSRSTAWNPSLAGPTE